MKQKPKAIPDKLFVNSQLQGDEVVKFLQFKKREYLRNNSEVGRKLILERLAQLEREEATA